MKTIGSQSTLALFLGLLAASSCWAISDDLEQPASVKPLSALETNQTLPTVAAVTRSSDVFELAAYDSCLDQPTCSHKSRAHGASQPWSLPQPCFLQRHGIKLGGWLEQGITFNGDKPGDRFNGPVATNDIDSEYQMNQMWLYLDRPADNHGEGWAWGGHIDIMYGTDWRFGINHGLEDRINGFNRQTYGTVLPQFYAEVAYNRLSVKLGHFGAILDYEMVPAIFNPFYSHSYSYGYTVPQLVTGVLANYRLTDQWSVQSGFTRGWSMFEDYNNDLDFMGGIKWESCDKKSSVAWAVNSGAQDFRPLYPTSGENERFTYSLVVKQQLSKKMQYVLVHNLGTEQRAAPGGENAQWYGINQYFLYAINPKWQANLRVEWMRDDDGARIAGPGNIPGVRAWDGFGFAGNFYEVTAGLNWRPRPNLIFRPEIRWDWFDGAAGPRGLPFDNGSDDDQFLVGGDLILTF